MDMRFDLKTGLLAAALAFGAAGAKAQSTKVEDFESKTTINLLGGFWYFYDDRTDSGASVITTADTATGFWDSTTFAAGAEGSASAIKLGFRFGAKDPKCGGTCTYSPMVGMGTNLMSGGALDLTGATAISFWAKADAPLKIVFSMGTTEIKDNGNYAKLVPVTASWSKYSVSLAPGAELKQPSWAKKVAFNPAEAFSLGWQISKSDNAGMAGGALYVDQIVVENWAPPIEPISIRNVSRGRASDRGVRAIASFAGKHGTRVDAMGRNHSGRTSASVPTR